jgi:transcriptional regulator with XRE-family HTH domain
MRKSHKELKDKLVKLIGNKLSYEQIREALGVSRSAVHYWFHGRNRPDRKHLLRLYGLLQTPLEDVEEAFALADYYLTPKEVAQVKAWQPADQQSPTLQRYNEFELQLEAVKGLKSGTALEDGLRFAKSLVERIELLIKEERAQTRLLVLYFDALDEVTQLQNLLLPHEDLYYADRRFYEKMQRIYDETKDKRLHARLLASQGDEAYVLGRHRTSYRQLKDIIDPSVVEPELYIRPILRSSCLDLSYPQVGSEADFQHVADLLEAAIDQYANTINPMLIVLGLEGLSRAYANRYEHTRVQEYKKQALQKLEAAETLMNQSLGYPIFGLRVEKARVRLAHMGVLEGISLPDQAAKVREVKSQFGVMGESRSVKDMDDILVKIER